MADNIVFLDTVGWIALLNASDALHRDAMAVWTEISRRGTTVALTGWIIAETGNGLARTPARAGFSQACQAVLSSPRARVVHVDEPLLRDAIHLYAERRDKTWGLVDCASFVLMRNLGIEEAFTNDHHFEQAGFRRLLPY